MSKQRLEFTPEEILEFKELEKSKWINYASTSVKIPGDRTARLTLAFNGNEEYIVELGVTVVYRGNDLGLAIEAWDTADWSMVKD